jgi:hypothetical protein
MPSSTLCVTKGNKQELRITCHAYNPELQKISTLTHSELMTFNCHNNNFLKNNLGKNIENGKTQKKKRYLQHD